MKFFIIFLVIVAAVILLMVVKNLKIPSGLGVNEGRLSPVPKSPNAVSTQADDPAKRVEPLPFNGDLESTLSRIKSVLNDLGGITIINQSKDYIHAVSTTARMKYHDDLEFYLDEKASLVHFRSKSRVGYSDMGVNKKRYIEIAKRYKG